MKVAVEIQPLLDEHMTGVGWYTDNLVRLLKDYVRPGDYYYLLGMDYYGRAGRLDGYTASNVELRVNGIMHYGIYRRLAKFIPFVDYNGFFRVEADIFHFVNFVVPPRVKGSIINTVYDMVYKTFPETMEKANYRKLDHSLKDSCSRADAIITISENSKRELMGYLGIPEKKIHIIPPGVDLSVYRPMRNQLYAGDNGELMPDAEKSIATDRPGRYQGGSGSAAECIRKYGLPEKYLLYLGTIEPRKNIPVIIRSFHQFSQKDKQGYKLVIAGKKGWMFREVFELVEKLGLEEKVIFPGYVAEEDKPYLYGGADVFLFPSLYEGFGMPPLEAMACGVPVIVSNTSSLPEVVGDAGIQIDPSDVDAISNAILELTSNPELCRALSEKGLKRAQSFTWEDSVKKLLKVYDLIL
jgi:glycosyltransferase involved in cell wall biosynthesis